MKITDAQLQAIVADYERLLENWKQISPESLARVDGPIVQAIGFQVLSSGDYRPMNCISVLVAPEPGGRRRPDFFVQMPKGSPRTLSLRSHKQQYGRMLDTMKREFLPRIFEPLHAEAVLELGEKDGIVKSGQAYALAALNAYFGRIDRARYWCSKFPELVNELGRPWEQWHSQQKTFLDSLEEWIRTGEVKARLEKILEQERMKWNLTT